MVESLIFTYTFEHQNVSGCETQAQPPTPTPPYHEQPSYTLS